MVLVLERGIGFDVMINRTYCDDINMRNRVTSSKIESWGTRESQGQWDLTHISPFSKVTSLTLFGMALLRKPGNSGEHP